MLLFLFGSINGNKPDARLNGLGFLDVAIPSYGALIVGTSGLLSMTNLVATYRERGILKRFRAVPVRPLALLIAQGTAVLLMTTAGVGLLIVVGRAAYGVTFEGNALAILAAFLLSSVATLSLGFLLASVMPTSRTAQAGAQLFFFPMMFLSGAAFPREVLPDSLHDLSEALPLTHVVELMRGAWIGETWRLLTTDIIFLFVTLVLATVISAKIFRWE